MLTARKNRAANWLIYHLLILGPTRRHFHTVNLRQIGLPAGSERLPWILYGNHSSWWDAYMAMLVNERCWHRDGYVMMEDTQLARYQFFRYAGAFSVNRRHPRSAAESVRYVTRLLVERPDRMLLIFPQGEIRANDARPLGFQTGVGHIIKRIGRCLAIPMALRYEFIGEQRPEAFISVGQALELGGSHDGGGDGDGGRDTTGAKGVTLRLEQELTAELDRLRDDVVAYRFDSFTALVQGTWSVNRAWDALRGRAQLRWLGPDDHRRT